MYAWKGVPSRRIHSASAFEVGLGVGRHREVRCLRRVRRPPGRPRSSASSCAGCAISDQLAASPSRTLRGRLPDEQLGDHARMASWYFASPSTRALTSRSNSTGYSVCSIEQTLVRRGLVLARHRVIVARRPELVLVVAVVARSCGCSTRWRSELREPPRGSERAERGSPRAARATQPARALAQPCLGRPLERLAEPLDRVCRRHPDQDGSTAGSAPAEARRRRASGGSRTQSSSWCASTSRPSAVLLSVRSRRPSIDDDRGQPDLRDVARDRVRGCAQGISLIHSSQQHLACPQVALQQLADALRVLVAAAGPPTS